MNAGQAAAELTGVRAVEVRHLGNSVFEVDLEDGDLVVVKRHDDPNAVLAEAKSLEWLAEPEGPPVPGVRAHGENWLVMDQVERGAPSPEAAEEFGRRLAALHATGAPAFGAPPPDGPENASIGLAPMLNRPHASWADWFKADRIDFYLRKAVDQGELTPDQARVVEAVRVEAPDEPPARLHGDLWNGNVHWAADGRAWLIDPAAHGGHRESDLAMLHLFGCTHLDRIVAAYQEVTPLADGWRDRIPLHQLFPLLVHVALFGGSYVQQTLAAARALP
ncbi:fructosamine kinase family protein [Saccharothrix variisporea]|uniref:Fructosamine-3-kinase n=1 Tax=Saccharothrix variisporea TaxID=543527 RepID=A0A495XD31_9PSEU|nr:fructosamine kinase family protein [Saccharothrix variisporea]RKT70523.1 fructosamine-3-kinase [Saccharothrix variisporea]